MHYVPYEEVSNETIAFNDTNYTFYLTYNPQVPRFTNSGVDIYITCEELGFKNRKIPFSTDGGCSYVVDVPKNVTKFTLHLRSYEKGFPFASEHIIYNVVRK